MRALIDIGHPAHVHYFRHLAKKITDNGGSVLFTLREKEMTLTLVKAYGLDYYSFGKAKRSIAGKIFAQFSITFKLLVAALRYKPDVVLNSTHYSAFVSWLIRKPHISIEDTFNMEQVRLYTPFTNVIITGDYPHPSMPRQLLVDAFQESLYLRSEYFTPDPQVIRSLGVEPGEKFSVVRFVSWTASHDMGLSGMSSENRVRAVEEFSSYGKVFITSEVELPRALEKFRVKIPVDKIHHLLYYASLVFSEGATMVTEAALLGTPSVYLSSKGIYDSRYLAERYGIVFNLEEEEAIEKGCEILKESSNINDKRVREEIEKDTADYTSILYEVVKHAVNNGRRRTTPLSLLKAMPEKFRKNVRI